MQSGRRSTRTTPRQAGIGARSVDWLARDPITIGSSPGRCVKLVDGIVARRKEIGCDEKPIFVWEPVPDACTTSALREIRKAVKYIDIVSPNLSELSALFGQDETPEEEVKNMESRCMDLLEEADTDQAVIVPARVAADGIERHLLQHTRPIRQASA